MRRWSRRRGPVGAGSILLLCALVAGCTSSGPAGATSRAASQFPSPLPTRGSHVNLLCGFVSRSSVDTALGRSDYTVSGELSVAPSPNPDGTTFSRAVCAVSLPGATPGQAKAFTVTVEPVAITDLDIVRTSRPNGGAGYVYPTDVGVGFASRDSFTDAQGTLHKTADSGLIRGDWTITMGIATPAPGRDPLADAIAIAQEVIDFLRVPLKPTRAYPAAFYAADPSLPKP